MRIGYFLLIVGLWYGGSGSVVAAVSTVPGPVFIYDLTDTLHFDAQNHASVAKAWDMVHAVACLQGIVNRNAPTLYVRYVEAYGQNIDDYWLNKLSEPGQWLHGRTRQRVDSLPDLVRQFRAAIKGAVVYDDRVPATSNLASTIAGVEDLLPIRFDPAPESVYTQLITKNGLPVVRRLLNEDGSPLFTGHGTIPGTTTLSTGSAKCDAYLWLKHHYLDTGKVTAKYAAFYIDAWWMNNPTATVPNHHTLSNHDYFVSQRAFFFDLNIWEDETPTDDPTQSLGTDARTLQTLLKSAYQRAHGGMIHIGGFTPWAFKYSDNARPKGKHEAVATEWEYARVFSAYNAFVDADAIAFGAMANASFYAHFPLKKSYPQKWIAREQLRSEGYLTADGKINLDGRQFMVIYVGDYDAGSWVYQNMPVFWEHPDRGKVPLMWCISPVLENRVGFILDYLRQTASDNDYFAAADNGAGYLNPGMLQEPRPVSRLPSGVQAWARHCKPFYERWGLSITGFVIDGSGPGLNKEGLDAYASFSPNGIVPQKVPTALLHGNMPVLRSDWDLNGTVEQCAATVRNRIGQRKLPFHWFRAILRGPDWYAKLHEQLKETNPEYVWLDAPRFFELLRVYLETTPAAAETP